MQYNQIVKDCSREVLALIGTHQIEKARPKGFGVPGR